jgi:hypothetical protein
MKIVIDRFEGDYAIVEIAGTRVDVPRALIPADCKEGDALQLARAPVNAASAAEARLARLKARSPQGSGDIDL